MMKESISPDLKFEKMKIKSGFDKFGNLTCVIALGLGLMTTSVFGQDNKEEPAKKTSPQEKDAKKSIENLTPIKKEGEDNEGKDGYWCIDAEKALATAKKENKSVLMNFTGSDWCGWCIKLEGEVFSKREFSKAALK